MTQLLYTPGIPAAGERVTQLAAHMKQVGTDMYARVRSIVGTEALEGALADALEVSQQRWNTICDNFATTETAYGNQVVNGYQQQMATDGRAAARLQV